MSRQRVTAAIIATAVIVGIITFVFGFSFGMMARNLQEIFAIISKNILPPYMILLLALYLVLSVIDFCGGVVNANARGELSSSKMREGLVRKTNILILMLITIILCGVINVISTPGLGIDLTILKPAASLVSSAPAIVILYYIIMESVSIYERAKNSGAPVPSILGKLVKTLQKLLKVPSNNRRNRRRSGSDGHCSVE